MVRRTARQVVPVPARHASPERSRWCDEGPSAAGREGAGEGDVVRHPLGSELVVLSYSGTVSRKAVTSCTPGAWCAALERPELLLDLASSSGCVRR